MEALKDLDISTIQMYKYTIHSVIPDSQAFYEFIQLIENKNGYNFSQAQAIKVEFIEV